MKKLKILFAFLFASSLLFAETTDAEYALFKRNISPAMMWGEDGLILVPKANTMGRGHLYLSANVLDAGKIQGDKLFLTSGTIMLSTSDDVELGYTRRVFIWDNLDYTNIKMDTWHLKARVFHLKDNYIPQLAVGVNLVSISANDFSNQDDILYNPYVTLTIRAPLGTEKAVLSVTACAEKIYNEGESTDVMFSGGVDFRILNHLYLIGEIQGVNKEGDNGIINVGAKLKFGWVSLGAGLFNISRTSLEGKEDSENKRYWMANIALDIPFDRLFK